jgi:hypothetical protein
VKSRLYKFLFFRIIDFLGYGTLANTLLLRQLFSDFLQDIQNTIRNKNINLPCACGSAWGGGGGEGGNNR